MAEAISLRGLVQRTPEEALAYLQQKDQRITWNYWEMRGEAHARSFTVAKAARLDILSDIRRAVEKAVAEGETERWFTKDLEPVLRKKGWWGKQVDVDPDTGEAQLYQAGSYRRLQTIYRTNMQTAYMAGRWKQFEAEKARAPFVQYLAVRDARTRPSHAAMHGKVFRIDDPAWQAIAPPNGFNCRCRARNLSEKEVERRGLKVENDVRLHEREASGQPPVDKRTGETLGEWRQRGISIPDPVRPGERVYLWADQGWDYNPGDAWARTDKGGLWPDCQDGGSDFAAKGDCLGVLRGQKTWRSYGRLDLRDPGIRRQDAPQLVDRTATRGEALAVLEVALGVTAARPTRIVQTPVEPVIIAHPWLSHVIEKEADGRERFANFILPTLEDPFEVWNVRYADGGLRRRYIGLFTGRHDLMVIVRENEDGSLLWNALQADPKRMNKLRIGALLYGK